LTISLVLSTRGFFGHRARKATPYSICWVRDLDIVTIERGHPIQTDNPSDNAEKENRRNSLLE